MGALLLALHMVMNAEKLLLDSQKGLQNLPAIYVGKPVESRLGVPSVHPFWPEFTHSDAGAFQSSVINGVQVMTEEWNCSASSDAVLSYYRDQMTARGWQDATEPAKDFGQITVKFYAAATPSIENFFQQTVSSALVNQGPDGQPMNVVQDNGSEHYHTTIATKNASPDQAFQSALADLGTKGWRPVMFLPKQKTRPGFFAWLVRGKQYAALSVSAAPQGGGSSVTFTEVTPD